MLKVYVPFSFPNVVLVGSPGASPPAGEGDILITFQSLVETTNASRSESRAVWLGWKS